MWRRHLFLAIIFFIAVVIQTSFATVSDWQFRLNLVIPVLIVCALIYSFEYAAIWVIITGYLLDLFSFLNFGVITLSIFFTIAIIYFVAKNFIDHQSWWSMTILIIGATVLNYVLMLSFSFVIYKMNVAVYYLPFDIWHILSQIAVNCALILIAGSFRKGLERYLIIYEKS